MSLSGPIFDYRRIWRVARDGGIVLSNEGAGGATCDGWPATKWERHVKAYRIDTFTGAAGLKLVEEETPTPGRGQILVKLYAASLNFRDSMIVQGFFGPYVRAGIIPLSDGAGEVVAVGEDATRFAVGDRVMPIFNPHWIGGKRPIDVSPMGLGGEFDGTLAQYILVDDICAVRIPDHLSYEEAATLPCAGVTAWSALVQETPPLPGETVVTQGTGGVSIFALQFAKLFGARVIATSSSDAKLARLRDLGADETINYRDTPAWDARVKELTGGLGADLIVEVGGAGTLPTSFRAAHANTRIAIVGMVAGASGGEGFDFMSWIASTYRTGVGSRGDFEDMNRAIAWHRVKPVVDRVFGFDEVAAAFEYFDGKSYFGKVVIRID